jgi:hypothetical protein
MHDWQPRDGTSVPYCKTHFSNDLLLRYDMNSRIEARERRGCVRLSDPRVRGSLVRKASARPRTQAVDEAMIGAKIVETHMTHRTGAPVDTRIEVGRAGTPIRAAHAVTRCPARAHAGAPSEQAGPVSHTRRKPAGRCSVV